jgi:hypothetical protein
MYKHFIQAALIFSLITFTLSLEAKDKNSKKIKTQKESVKFAKNQVAHIKDRHWHNAATGNKTSHFNKSMTVKKLHGLATKTIKEGNTTSSAKVHSRKVHEYTFKKPIGTTTNGQKAHTLRVVTDQKGEIVTSFPSR